MRYVLFPGCVISAKDGQDHYISGVKLAQLYDVNYRNSIVVFPGQEHLYKPGTADVALRPREDGNYSLEDAVKRSIKSDLESWGI